MSARIHVATSALAAAAGEFLKDESRRASRAQNLRLDPAVTEAAASFVSVIEGGYALAEGKTDAGRAASIARGRVMLNLFRYSDSLDAVAADLITDLLHAVAAEAYDAQDVLDHAIMYYAEEKAH